MKAVDKKDLIAGEDAGQEQDTSAEKTGRYYPYNLSCQYIIFVSTEIQVKLHEERVKEIAHCSYSLFQLTKRGGNVTSKFRQYIKISASARDSRVRLARWQNGKTSKQSTEALQNLGRAQDICVQTREGRISPAGTRRRHSSTY